MEMQNRPLFGPQINLGVIASCVEALILDGATDMSAEHRSHGPISTVDLGEHERGALDALRRRLNDDDSGFLDSLVNATW